jgi:AN1-type zinc finger protein 5/6
LAEGKKDGKKIQKDTNRCFSCNKRIGLAGFKCRCEYVFCSLHRQSDKHNCTFDYKAHGRDVLTKANPAVIADKVEKVLLALFFKFKY